MIEVRACATAKKPLVQKCMRFPDVKRGGASLPRGAHIELDGHTHLVHLLKQGEWEMWIRREAALMLVIWALHMRVAAGGDVLSGNAVRKCFCSTKRRVTLPS
jgi:hypothetical protein